MRRRRFLGRGALVLAAGSFCGNGSAGSQRLENRTSRVVRVRDAGYKSPGRAPDEQTASEMIARVVRELAGTGTLADSWRSVLGTAKVVGLKPNCLAGRGVSSSPEFVHAVAAQVIDNVPGIERVVIWERSDRDLRQAGFEIVTKGRVQCYGNDRAGFSRSLTVKGSVGSLFSRVVTRTCDRLINLPVLKDHGIVGVSVGLKNYYGAVHNPNKYHLNRGDPYVADLNSVEYIRGKNVLTLCEAFTAQYEGGPPYKPHWSWPEGAVLASIDPVALDRVGWKIIEEQRAAGGFPTLAYAGREPTYILTAGDNKHSLGQADLERIHEVVLE
ncbi:MAG: DUF362 domain-containing protein [Gemmatimonadota bacterium]|nr:DUF362 domain-containing protein [Gemmatimonadota bacterium]